MNRTTATIAWDQTRSAPIPEVGERVPVRLHMKWGRESSGWTATATPILSDATVRRVYRHIRKLCVQVGERHYLIAFPSSHAAHAPSFTSREGR